MFFSAKICLRCHVCFPVRIHHMRNHIMAGNSSTLCSKLIRLELWLTQHQYQLYVTLHHNMQYIFLHAQRRAVIHLKNTGMTWKQTYRKRKSCLAFRGGWSSNNCSRSNKVDDKWQRKQGHDERGKARLLCYASALNAQMEGTQACGDEVFLY